MKYLSNSTEDRIVNTNDMPVRFAGMLIIFITFGIFGVWSAFAPLDSAALATGVVSVKGNRKTVQHLEGGIIREIYVKDGDLVKTGAPLVRLDATQQTSELKILKGQYSVFAAREARLIAERDEQEMVTFPSGLTKETVAIEAVLIEKQQFSARKSSLEGEISLNLQRIEQLKAQADGLRALIKSKNSLTKSYIEEIKDNQELLSEGFVDKQRLRDLLRTKEQLSGEIAEHSSHIAAITVQIGEAELQILQLRKNFRSEVINSLAETQTRLFDISERIRAVEDRVNRSHINAPVDGVVLGLGYHTLGGVISPGKPIMDIVPEGEDLIIEAQVSPVDIDRVQIGLEADVRFSAFKSAITPVVKGKVISLSADRLENKEGHPYYLAHVELTNDAYTQLGGAKLVAGMPAEVLINTGARTLLEYLLQPATNAFARSMIED